MADQHIIMVDVAYRPLEFWAEQWGKDGQPLPITTIRTWIRHGKCPAKKIGGQWMISTLELLNWTPPHTDVESNPEKDEKNADGEKAQRRRNLRNAEGGSDGPLRKKAGRKTDRWAL